MAFDWKSTLPFIGNAAGDLGYGIAKGGFKNGFGIAAERGSQMQPYRDQQASARKTEMEQAAQQNATLEWLKSKAGTDPRFADLVAGVESGAIPMGDAWTTGLSLSAQPEPVKGIEINGRLVNPMTGEEMGNFADPPEGPKPPSGYQYKDDNTLTFIPGGPADPAAQAANKGDTEQTRRAKQLASVVNPELQVVEQNWDALTNGWDQLKNAELPGIGQPGRMFTDPGFQQASTALQTIAQSYLYSVSGAAAPAEEVRKIVQSVTPVFGESEQSRNDKRARVRQMVDAINLMASGGNQSPAEQPGSGYKVLSVE